ncbi:HAD family hydrolase [Phyllobacterium phragmitis]|uniref:phosphoglycolate phosphatase n=1 Tax=Phyllobacterium phragmitis TaxID=2670329 RepID=A0A2S9IM80_9HYPH|nr:HAD family hydrolase [Phyllobacterium phragmitis]PRD41638.1 HAD family hydrolase [Phyllobacterium phragmitis]
MMAHMPLRAIRAILFDKDGTLVDFNRTWFGISKELARRSAGGDEAKARALLEEGGYDWEAKRFRANSVIAAGTVEDVVDLWHPDASEADRAALIREYNDYCVSEGARAAVAIDGLQGALEALRREGYLLGIATNDSEAGARATAEALGLTNLFHTFIGYDTALRPKPHPDPVHHFARATGLEAWNIAMVGDNPHDMETARAADAGYAIGVLSGNSSREVLEPLADAVLPSVADLPAFLASSNKRPVIEKVRT